MTTLNQLRDRTSGGNTGIPSQVLIPDNITGAILCDPSFKLTTANRASLTTLKSVLAAATLVIGTGRIYPISNFDDPENNSADLAETTTAYGRTVLGSEGGYNLGFRMHKTGYEVQKNLRKFNDRTLGFYFVDKDNVLYGTENSDGELLPFSGTFHAKKMMLNDGANEAKFMVKFYLDEVTQVNDALGWEQYDWNFFDEIKGIIDVTITEVSHTGTTAVVKVTSAYKSIDLGALFESILETPANWRLYPVAGGSDVVPSGIVYTAPTGTDTVGIFTITHASLSASHYLSLDTPAILAAAGMGGTPDNGYESNTITVAYS